MGGQLVIACGEATELLQVREQVLDQVARSIAMRVEGSRAAPIRAWRNDRLGAGLFDGLDQRIRVVSLVGDDGLHPGQCVDQGLGLGDVGLLGAAEREDQGIAQRIADQVDLGAPAAARAAQ